MTFVCEFLFFLGHTLADRIVGICRREEIDLIIRFYKNINLIYLLVFSIKIVVFFEEFGTSLENL